MNGRDTDQFLAGLLDEYNPAPPIAPVLDDLVERAQRLPQEEAEAHLAGVHDDTEEDHEA